MRKIVKNLIMVSALCALSAFAVMASGCNDYKDKINELKCDHVMDEGEVTKDPTCQEEGEYVKSCTLCTYTEKKTMKKLDHAVVKLPAVAATCTKSAKMGKKRRQAKCPLRSPTTKRFT